jgi:hypothetical protein
MDANQQKLVMLGVVHRDQDGPRALREWMERIEPDVVTLEFSNYGLEFRMRRTKEYRERIDETLRKLQFRERGLDPGLVRGLYSYIDLPYEFETASDYSANCSVPFYLIDMDLFSYLKLRDIDELVSECNIEKLIGESGGTGSVCEEAAARLFFDKGVMLTPYTDEMYIRDRYMSNRIMTLTRYYRGKRILHICGWRHLQDPYNIYGPLGPGKVYSHDKALRI